MTNQTRSTVRALVAVLPLALVCAGRVEAQFPRTVVAMTAAASADVVRPTRGPKLVTQRRAQDLSGFHMITELQIGRDGRMRGSTETVSHTALAGHCGASLVTLLAEDGEILGTVSGDRYCVGATKVPFDGPTRRVDNFDRALPRRARGRVAHVRINHTERSKPPEETVGRFVKVVNRGSGDHP